MRSILAVVADALCVLRILLGLSFPWLPVHWRFGVVVLAAFSDLIDGPLKRRVGGAGNGGQLLDPVADKLFVGMVLATLLFDQTLQVWEVLLIGVRDLAVLAGMAFLWLRGGGDVKLQPSLLGKATTAGQFAFLGAVLAAPTLAPWFLWPTATVSILAGTDYGLRFLRAPRPE